ncbi:hypothetical protein [Streptomyces scopuliridis]|uniref:Uncharacterized protein n=1 Tax=Streptomyces scopuliridis TaxID=452529 RepID=A0ACD4ZPV8_9ACTN|nr:hypothetical protein [Streptomyces scopuliridis]WSC00062.1 hypothetical protein OG835_25755 [Streptomyces scopuliridis]
MATWTAPLPPDDTAAGDPGHPVMHNQLVDALTEVRTNVDLALPANDARLTAGAAGTATVRAIGATATTVVAGNDARLSAAAAGTASVRALAGGTATTASASDHTHTGLMTGTVAAVNNAATFTDLTAATTAYNALLAALRLRGVISGS